MNNYRYTWTDILANEYVIQKKYPRPQGDTPEYLKHFNDNIWAYKIAHTVSSGLTKLTPEGEKYLGDVWHLYCDVIGVHPYTHKPLHSDQEIIDDEDEDDDES
jgi:hypothetical protein